MEDIDNDAMLAPPAAQRFSGLAMATCLYERGATAHAAHLRQGRHRQTAELLSGRWSEHRVIVNIFHFDISPRWPGREGVRQPSLEKFGLYLRNK